MKKPKPNKEDSLKLELDELIVALLVERQAILNAMNGSNNITERLVDLLSRIRQDAQQVRR